MDRVGAWYYINLPHRTDRRKATEEQLRLTDCRNVARVEAVRDMTGGVGCIQSHINAIQAGVDDGHDLFVVMEDDMLWKSPEQADAALRKAIAVADKHPEEHLLYLLGTNPVQYFKSTDFDANFLRVQYAVDAGASLFSRAAAIEMLKVLRGALAKSKDLLRKVGICTRCIPRLCYLAADRIRSDIFDQLLVITDRQGHQPLHQPEGYSDLEGRFVSNALLRARAKIRKIKADQAASL